jgi:hypothetical protein
VWHPCYKGTYDVELNSTVLAYILNQCYKDKLLLGCGPTDSGVLTLAAWSHRKDVLYDCGKQRDCLHMADNVGWYYSDDHSWGFVRDGDSVNRMTCDTGEYTFKSITMLDYLALSIIDLNSTSEASSNSRLCWNTGSNGGGYRCGSHVGLNTDKTFQRVIYHAD